jgi:hypothetical protein
MGVWTSQDATPRENPTQNPMHWMQLKSLPRTGDLTIKKFLGLSRIQDPTRMSTKDQEKMT